MIHRYIENKYYMNDFLDVQLYPGFRSAKKGHRKQKTRVSSETQRRLNDENASKYFDRLVLLNFRPGDYILDLTYAIDPTSDAEAIKYIQNFMRRLKRIYKSAGAELKYIYVTERGVKNDRYHHHVFLSGGVDRDAIEEAWQFKGNGRKRQRLPHSGFANCKRLQFTNIGVAGMTGYVSGRKKDKKEAKKVGFRKWTSSKNLQKPEPKKNQSRLRRRDVEGFFSDCENRRLWEAIYPGYTLAECDRVYYNPVNGEYYISARLYKTTNGNDPGRDTAWNL